ncbi:MAG: TerC family protein [Planctomycetes bacterium]|nr:TerC family protein [Planctomycetota bacterium]
MLCTLAAEIVPHATEHALWSVESGIALLTLAALEIVLGIDNVIFIAILSGKLPEATRYKAQRLGILAAVGTRILLLLAITWLMGLTKPLWPDAPALLNLNEISGKGLILIVGGLFLVGKAVWELHEKLEVAEEHHAGGAARAAAQSLAVVVVQIMLIDIVFSLDSVITAVGMSGHVPVMIAAVMIAACVMVAFSRKVSDFVEAHPTIKILALAFLLLIGFMLFIEGFGQHVPKGYIYFAMAFSLGIELFNMAVKKKSEKVHLNNSKLPEMGKK